MRIAFIAKLSSSATIALLLACEPESDPVALKLQAMSFANSEWSEPVNLGPTINTGFNEQGPNLSKDGLTLYFGSDRPGGVGSLDRKSTRLNSSHLVISYAVFCLKKKKKVKNTISSYRSHRVLNSTAVAV